MAFAANTSRHLMTPRAISLAVVTFVIVVVIYNYSGGGIDLVKMAKLTEGKTTVSYLQVEIKQTLHSPPTITATITNDHPTDTLTILRWDTPLDPQALALGIFQVTDTATGQPVHSVNLMINRLLPASEDDLIELAPGSEQTAEFILKPPYIDLQAGRHYKIRVKGEWKAIWGIKKDDIAQKALEELGGHEDAITGSYESDSIALEVA
ncbi:hypothetical protein K402DRAFT_398372 [Aulographum hederae CBS 113979]|uniref:Uncharacterized protein n=1 Tax=Aulographum hederae CBS 113979 TaxID=1176131 RepID=A0A6G1GLC2_9PEZI|nr:hypothetical protein K402DRAFT_398372 [Aulographum hederae CBS 113979]